MHLLQQYPGVVANIPDRPVQAHGQVIPAGVQRIGAAPGQTAYTGNGVGVAIADTGIDFNHLDWIADNANLVSPRIRVVNMSLGRPGKLDDNPAPRATV